MTEYAPFSPDSSPAFNECSDPADNNCVATANCANLDPTVPSPAKYSCTCWDGFSGNGFGAGSTTEDTGVPGTGCTSEEKASIAYMAKRRSP